VVYTAGAFAVPKLSAACVPWYPQLHLPPQANLSYGYTYYTLGPVLGAWERATSRPTVGFQEGLAIELVGGSAYGYEDGFPLTGGGLSYVFTLPAAHPEATSGSGSPSYTTPCLDL
jgi:hypothetical protein